MRARVTAFVFLFVAFAGVNVALSAERFRAIMLNSNEPSVTLTKSTGGARPASFGLADFILNDDETAMTMEAWIYNIDVTGLQTLTDTNDNLTNAHIHANDTVVGTGTAAVVWGFHGTPDHDNNPHDEVVIPFASKVGGYFSSVWNAPEGVTGGLAAQLNRIRTGHAYINFHTNQNAGGEIRGYLIAIPEPSSVLLFGVGGAALAFGRRRR